MSFIHKIEQIVECVDLVAIEPASYNRGLRKDRIVRLLEANGFDALAELVELYGWANGGHGVDGSYLIFFTLEEALEHFRDWHLDYGRPKTWFPIGTMNGDVVLYLDIETLALHSHDAELDDTRTLATHYAAFLDGIIEGFAQDGVGFDEDHYEIRFGPGVWSNLCQRFSVAHPWS